MLTVAPANMKKHTVKIMNSFQLPAVVSMSLAGEANPEELRLPVGIWIFKVFSLRP